MIYLLQTCPFCKHFRFGFCDSYHSENKLWHWIGFIFVKKTPNISDFFCKDCKLILNLVNHFSFECLVFLKLLGLVFVCHFIFIQTLLKVFNVLKMHQYLFTPLFLCRTKFTDLTTLRPLKLQNVMH
jgi:hypothetical protein